MSVKMQIGMAIDMYIVSGKKDHINSKNWNTLYNEIKKIVDMDHDRTRKAIYRAAAIGLIYHAKKMGWLK